MISTSLRRDIDQYASELRESSRLLHRARSGEISPVLIGRYLASILYLVRHTPIHLCLAEQRAREIGAQRLAAYFERKLREEVGHDEWAEADLKKMTELFGLPAPLEPVPGMVRLVGHVEQAIEREPHLYLAYILFAEYLTVSLGPEWVAALDTRCGVPRSALTVATHHIELDQQHVADGCDEIDSLVEDPGLVGPLKRMLRESMRHFSAFCDDVCDYAA